MSDLDPRAKTTGATPSVSGDGPAVLAKVIAFARNVKEALDSLKGINDPLDGAVTWRALANLGLVELNGGGRKTWKGGAIRHGSSSIGLPAGAADSTSPPAPIGFSASAGLAMSVLTWTEPDYSNHSYTEVWRNTSNSLTGAAMIGAVAGSVYADNVGVTAGGRYYWIRHVSEAGVIGPFNATGGTANTTLQVGASDIQALCITNALISNTAAIDSAKIASLTADKITSGTMTAQTITLSNSASSIIKSANFSAGSAGWQILGNGNAEFNNVTVRGTINASDITAGTLDVARLGANTIESVKLAVATVETSRLANNAVSDAVTYTSATGSAGSDSTEITYVNSTQTSVELLSSSYTTSMPFESGDDYNQIRLANIDLELGVKESSGSGKCEFYIQYKLQYQDTSGIFGAANAWRDIDTFDGYRDGVATSTNNTFKFSAALEDVYGYSGGYVFYIDASPKRIVINMIYLAGGGKASVRGVKVAMVQVKK